ncbi:MAG TPA: SRPBCC family protein [Candidatus Acidoferrum sp.]|nr:SRPBCC family protein [Candidatus Acidoferrum sp.]
MPSTDRIEKSLFLRAPQERVWHAISDAQAFGSWFGMEFDGAFAPGKAMRGRIVPTTADPDVAKMQEKYRGMPVAIFIEEIAPMRTFSYRWHPFAIDSDVDYSHEPMTLVTFTLEPADGGTKLTITETGFDSIPLARRADAFEANAEGWAAQLTLIEKYLLQPQS